MSTYACFSGMLQFTIQSRQIYLCVEKQINESLEIKIGLLGRELEKQREEQETCFELITW
jgi:hypothetical protein